MPAWDTIKQQAYGLANYGAGGAMLTAGLEPVAHANGFDYWRFGAADAMMQRAPFGGALAPMGIHFFPDRVGAKTMMGMWRAGGWEAAEAVGSTLGASFQLGFGAYDVWKGYQENGLKGAWNSIHWNLASNAAVAKFAYMRNAATGVIEYKGMASLIGRQVGAGLGASVGEALLGAPGAYVGAYVGAAPLSALGGAGGVLGGMIGEAGVAGMAIGAGFAAPVVIGTLGVAAATMGTYYGAYQLARIGVNRTRSKRRIETSGDMSAFMTQNVNTMRARSVQAIARSHMNARSALGQEANFMHTRKNYFSSYR